MTIQRGCGIINKDATPRIRHCIYGLSTDGEPGGHESLGILVLLPTALAHGLFMAVILVALGFSYISSRAQWRSALVIATVDPTLYSLATIALIAFAALVILSIPLILVFFLSASGIPWIFLPEPAAMLLAAGLIGMTLAVTAANTSRHCAPYRRSSG
ncbi:hypothetical protein [Candidatus Chloroploca sp. Khr17]|uniref:hypothetical protein n=1 Tax=Candidatus Chloroploca sp. Khr17 TaxID=2496869 RepID=UPI00101C8092|nr:hypothetical protein [Candidatus Chloroploca sp. Khr17]